MEDLSQHGKRSGLGHNQRGNGKHGGNDPRAKYLVSSVIQLGFVGELLNVWSVVVRLRVVV